VRKRNGSLTTRGHSRNGYLFTQYSSQLFPRLLLYFRKPQSTYFYSDSKIVIHMAHVKLTRHCRA